MEHVTLAVSGEVQTLRGTESKMGSIACAWFGRESLLDPGRDLRWLGSRRRRQATGI